jgi:hypothetical protein
MSQETWPVEKRYLTRLTEAANRFLNLSSEASSAWIPTDRYQIQCLSTYHFQHTWYSTDATEK